MASLLTSDDTEPPTIVLIIGATFCSLAAVAAVFAVAVLRRRQAASDLLTHGCNRTKQNGADDRRYVVVNNDLTDQEQSDEDVFM